MASPLDQAEFARWREEAASALRGAQLNADGDLHNWACFVAEQAAQLALKGLLHGLGRAPWGHDLLRLGELAGEAGVELDEATAARLRRLGRHYIPARYPDAHPSGSAGGHYGASDSAEAIADATALLTFVDETWTGLAP